MNKKAFTTVLILLLAVALFLLFSGGDDEVRNLPLGDGPIVAFGDSLVAGNGSTKGNDFVSLLSAKIGEQIMNKGVPGDTTASGLTRIDEIVALKPRLTIVLLGGNDFLRRVPREETFANLRAIIGKLQESGSAVLVLGVRGGVLSDSADSYYEDLADDTRSAYVSDVLDGLFGNERFMADSIHPNDAGYARIAERVYPALRDLLR